MVRQHLLSGGAIESGDMKSLHRFHQGACFVLIDEAKRAEGYPAACEPSSALLDKA